jgi:hypothetical protein
VKAQALGSRTIKPFVFGELNWIGGGRGVRMFKGKAFVRGLNGPIPASTEALN